MNKKTFAIVAGVMTAILLAPAMSMVYAELEPYLGNVGPQGQTGAYTLEETLKLAQARQAIVAENKGLGSGTPLLSLDGMVGSSIISAGIFGGIAAAFFVRGKSGKYAAMGRG